MPSSRRHVLVGLGAGVAGVGGLGYRYRNRLRRRFDLESIERALETAATIVEEGDDELEPLPEGVNELPDDEWKAAAELAWLYYREAEAFADVIPNTLALVTQ